MKNQVNHKRKIIAQPFIKNESKFFFCKKKMTYKGKLSKM